MSEFLNRAFMYGESVFTTMRMIDGEIQDWNDHFQRLKLSAEFVFGPFSEEENWAILLKDRLENRCQSETGQKILRIALFREQERGLRSLSSASVQNLRVAVTSMPYESHQFGSQPLKLRTCAGHTRPSWWPSYLKAGSYLESILAQKLYLQEGDDDLLFLNAQDEILETTVSNIFVVKQNRLYTPPLGPNVLDGVIRKKILKMAPDFFAHVTESSSSVEQLLKADAVFGCNSIRGPFLIGMIDHHNYAYSQEFLDKFELLKKRVFK